MNFATACFSMNSDMSKRISARSDPNRYSASDAGDFRFADAGRAEEKERTDGLVRVLQARHASGGSHVQEREIAGRCETMRLCSSVSIPRSFSASSCLIDDDGNAGPACDDLVDVVLCHLDGEKRIFERSQLVGDQLVLVGGGTFPVFDRLLPRRLAAVLALISQLCRAPASSRTSIALSGRKRSAM